MDPVFAQAIRAFYFISERRGTTPIAVKHRDLFPVFQDGAVAMPDAMVAAVATAVSTILTRDNYI